MKGAGETIAVIDTGIDYTHPDLGGGFGKGHKVAAGYDFYDNDSDPMDDNGHGTLVAGIAAADAQSPGGRTGVAPAAILTAYKVFGAGGDGYESTVIAGLEAAVGADNPYRAGVVNMSLSGEAAPDNPLDQASENAERAGSVVVAAAGNAAPGDAPDAVGSPAEAPDVLAVGASTAGVAVPELTVTSPVQHRIPAQRLSFSANPPGDGEDLDVVDVGAGQPSDYAGRDVSGKAVLFDYNSQQLPDLLATAEQHGAAAALASTPNFYLSGPQPGPVTSAVAASGGRDDPGRLSLVAAIVNGTDATDLSQWLAHGPVRIHIGARSADQVADFSAQGPAAGTYALKPDLVAPGVEIGSTWPGGGYADDSGTSLAAPHVAGAAALLRQAHPAWTAAQVAAALTGGAHPLPGDDATDQGAGRLDAAASDRLPVLAGQTTVDLGLADLNSRSVRATRTVTFTNVSATTRTLRFRVRPAQGTPAHVTVSPGSARLTPGARTTVRLSLSADRPLSATNMTGWLQADVDGGATVTVPYLMAVRPLELHVSPDPTPSDAVLYIHSEPDLVSAPRVRLTPPRGREMTGTATPDHDGWWRYTLPAGPAGVYRVSASAPTPSGATVVGQTSYEHLASTGSDVVGGWQSVGPYSQGAGQIGFSSQPGRMFAAPAADSPHAGVFRTDDNGATWHELRALPIGDGTNVAMATDVTQPGTLYLAVDGGSDPTFQGRVLVSHDAGVTWSVLPAPDVSLQDLSIDPTGRILTAPAWDGNVYVSTDRGLTWRSYPSPAGDLQQAHVVGHDLYIADGANVYVVRDIDGSPSAPRKIFTAPGDAPLVSDVVGDGTTLVAQTPQELFTSRDGGATWKGALTTDDDFTTVQMVHSAIYAGTSSKIWVDKAGNGEWASMAAPAVNDFLHVGAPAGNTRTIVVSAEAGGIFVTDDGGRSYRRIGISAADVHALAIGRGSAGEDLLVAGTTYSSYATVLPESGGAGQARSDWGSNHEEGQLGADVTALAVDPGDPRVLYRALTNSLGKPQISRSTDGGRSWADVKNVVVSGHVYQIVVDPVDPDCLYIAIDDALSPGVLVSRDAGKSWRKNDLPVSVTSIVPDPRNADSLWLGGPDGLFHSDDQGQSVTRLSTTPVTAMAVDPHDAKHLVVGGDGLWNSHDSGRTLIPATGSGLEMNVTALQFGPGGRLYGADGATSRAGLPIGGRGVLRSGDGGRSWQNVSASLPDLDVTSLAVSSDGKWLYAGTSGGSVYRAAAVGSEKASS